MTQARRRIQSASPAASPVHVRRSYIDGRNGQLHLTTAYPAGGGFDERIPLLCLHPAAASGAWFRSLLPELGRDRSVYAPDLPAHGQSDPPDAELALADHVAAIGNFLDGMRLRSVDLLGHQLGAAVAMELAVQRPEQVRKLALVAMPEPLDAQKAAKPGAARLAAIAQQTLLLYPADLPAAAKSPSPHHHATVLAQSSAEIYGNAAPELARVLRAFLDR